MKISNNKLGGAQPNIDAGKTGRADAAGGLQKSISPGGVAGEKAIRDRSNVQVSERAQMMQKAKDIASDPSIDEAKVARLQKLIDEGKYKVDANSIADKLVDEHLLIPD